MNKELKLQIINHIIENDKDFQLMNNTVSKFNIYIYNKGEYIIGGPEVYEFIKQAVKLLTDY